MSAEFSANISLLRKEKNISQKDAAEALGISQALLSHYEKGIRECSLEFVIKAAEYYEVTADYLLGMSDTKQVMNDILHTGDIAADTNVHPQTLLRCIKYLSEEAEKSGETAQVFFDNYFSLCVKKYLLSEHPENRKIKRLCDMVTDILTDQQETQETELYDKTDTPLALKTVEQHSDMLIAKTMAQLM